MYTLKTPGPNYHVDLDVHLDPRDGLGRTQILKIRILLKNWAINMFSVPLLLELKVRLFLAGDPGVPDD